jgi:hypothetical protein
LVKKLVEAVMKDLSGDNFSVASKERIKIQTIVDKRPCIVSFENPPTGGIWENIKPVPPCDQREFESPENTGNIFSFDVECGEGLAADDPDPVAHYTLTFTSLTNPTDPVVNKHINVPAGAGPVSRFFTFTVV